MEIGAIRQLLKNLCTNSQWCYAVFWKLQQLDYHNRILTCEEVYYCDSEKSQQPCQSIIIDPYTRQEALTSYGFESIVFDTNVLGYSIGAAVADMSGCQYLLGEGMVGRVALIESDFWFHADDIEFTELISNLGYGDDWFLPISAGIKTTLLAPVSPYGVLQLGSFEKVDENLALCADIRDRFYTLNYTTINPSSNFDNSLLCSIPMPESEDTDELCFCYSSLQRTEYEDTNIIHTPEFIQNYDIPIAYDQLVPFMDNDNSLDLKDLSFFIDDQDILYPNLDMANVVESDTVPNEFITSDHIHTPEETELWIYELQQALGPDFSRDLDELQQEAFESVFPKYSGLQEALEMEMCAAFDEGVQQEMLLEALISTNSTNIDTNNSDDADVFHQCNTSKSSVTSLTEDISYGVTNSASQGECNTVVLAYESSSAKCLTSPPSLESLESATIVHEQPLECTYEKNSTTEAVLIKPVKEKPKSRNRPRPRDRQLIQDRLKELRDLVPYSAKSSIDGLLDQTMKHMTFLKSVTERAEKVKHFATEEVTSTTKCQKNSNSEACPIIMKDLEHPSQFLIQMVCIDEGVFFEIAEVMHKLNLTILKGVMENRSNKWASFIVEASKGFNRLDIFWPLMRILQQNGIMEIG
ncbi:Transcription factor LHW [Bienertia sinuspersici]